jgi:hypothetical protein
MDEQINQTKPEEHKIITNNEYRKPWKKHWWNISKYGHRISLDREQKLIKDAIRVVLSW